MKGRRPPDAPACLRLVGPGGGHAVLTSGRPALTVRLVTSGKAGSGWSSDEYIVVADFYLRNGHSTNKSNPEVQALAELTGRSPSSISRRVGNFHGNATGGDRGLKPVSGEAATIFAVMTRDQGERERLVDEATSNLRLSKTSQPISLPARVAKLVELERLNPTTATIEHAAKTVRVVRREARLVLDYIDWTGTGDDDLRGFHIPKDRSTLRVDVYDVPRNLLIEAKAASTRENIRYSIGQLYDYRRGFDQRPALALLTETRPSDDLMELLTDTRIGVIWRNRKKFEEELA